MERRFGLFTCLGLLSLILAGCGKTDKPHEHTWGAPTYTWVEDYSSCIAERVCTQDSTHKESETVNSSYAVVTPATCEEGLGRYTTNVFENTAFSVQTKDVAIPANHNWGTPTYTWSNDYSTCTAERVCTTDASHKETEKVNSTCTVVTAATCEEEGLGRYIATFANSAFKTQIHDVTIEIDASGHIWGTPTYSWSSDYSTCTAERVCENNATHKETETVDSTYNIDPSDTFDSGTVKYNFSADFENLAFDEQTQVITKTYLGEFPVLNSEKTKVKYGLYPQKNVNDSALVSALNVLTTPESNGWYLYNNDYYAKVSATPNSSSYAFDNGTTIVSGTTYWFKCEPITWNVLSNTNGEYYILSSVLLDAHCYYNSASNRTIDGKTIYPNNYEYSDIRTWLNNDFYNSAFALGNTHIQTTTVDNSAATTNSSSNSYACNNTQDKVFLPSYKDYINSGYGFSTSTSPTDTRYCRTTDWARARGAYYYTSSGSYQYNGFYWTRSPYSDFYDRACSVNYAGSRSTSVHDITSNSVRPSLSIKIA